MNFLANLLLNSSSLITIFQNNDLVHLHPPTETNLFSFYRHYECTNLNILMLHYSIILIGIQIVINKMWVLPWAAPEPCCHDPQSLTTSLSLLS